MSERCPLDTGLHWGSRCQIPEFCLENCEKIWNSALQKIADNIDNFEPDCQHDVEFDDEALQRTEGPMRVYSILHTCMQGCGEAFAEEYVFECPKN